MSIILPPTTAPSISNLPPVTCLLSPFQTFLKVDKHFLHIQGAHFNNSFKRKGQSFDVEGGDGDDDVDGDDE